MKKVTIMNLKATNKIRLVDDFSKYPGGRLRIRGPFSGEEFYDDYLLPALEEHRTIQVDLNDASALAPSFLDESFGRLMKDFGKETYDLRVKIILDDDFDALGYLDEIRSRRLKKK
jgi:hypothetical protein